MFIFVDNLCLNAYSAICIRITNEFGSVQWMVCAKKMFDSDRKDSIQKMLRKGWVCQTGELHLRALISYEKREKSAAKGAMTLPS